MDYWYEQIIYRWRVFIKMNFACICRSKVLSSVFVFNGLGWFVRATVQILWDKHACVVNLVIVYRRIFGKGIGNVYQNTYTYLYQLICKILIPIFLNAPLCLFRDILKHNIWTYILIKITFELLLIADLNFSFVII